jgi:hypothetical protein
MPHGSAVFFIAWPERHCAHAQFSEGLACYVGARAALFAACGFLPMSPAEWLASKPAGVLLSGPVQARVARIRCACVMGENPKWLAALIAKLIHGFARACRAYSRDAIAQSILSSKAFHRAWVAGHPPRLNVLTLDSIVGSKEDPVR